MLPRSSPSLTELLTWHRVPDQRRPEEGDSWKAPVSGRKGIRVDREHYLCAPNSCSSRITSAEDKFTGVPPLGWARDSAAAAGAVPGEAFLPLACRDGPLSSGWSAMGVMSLDENRDEGVDV